MAERLIIGAMSGTSADGVDAALCSIKNRDVRYECRYIGHVEKPFPSGLKDQILAIRNTQNVTLENLSRLSQDISLQYAQAIHQLLTLTKTDSGAVSAIAAHGQTMFHNPPLTMQIFDPPLLAHMTHIEVISDFRRADCAAGGQGAPLVPFADYHLFKSDDTTRIILNIGGISNITVLKKNCTIDQVIGFDTGPGNCISDWIMRDQGGVDVDGKLAQRGMVNVERINRLMIQPYFHRPYPKSTDGPAMLDLWQRSERTDLPIEPIENQLATAAHWVFSSIVHGIMLALGEPFELFIAGGGTNNQAIMQSLMSWIKSMEIHGLKMGTLNIPSQAREAVAFALLGAATLDRLPANIPNVTGASKKVILGSITPASK